jgi:hypothetical protein
MAGAAGPNTAEAGLVFAYDTGNTITSYIGEPTTNLDPYTLSDSGTDGSGQSSVGVRTIISPNHVRIVDTASNTRQTHLVSGLTGNTTYTISIEFKKLSGTPTFRFQLQNYLNGSYQSTIAFTDTSTIGIQDIDGWQLASYTFTLGSGMNGLRIWFQDGADYTTYTHSFELRNPQLEAKSHPTPYTPPGTTRSATQSLLNLTSNGVIDVTNASFNSNAQLVFDGTNDTIFTADSTFINPGSSDFSIEVLFNCSNASVGEGIIYNKEDLYEATIHSGVFQYAWQPHWSWDGDSTFTVSSNTWYHAVVTYDKSYQRMYKNGVEVYNRAQSGNMGTNSVVLSMGARGVDSGGNSGYNFFPGQIPVVKVYKKALTANEVATNFQALRYRFGI